MVIGITVAGIVVDGRGIDHRIRLLGRGRLNDLVVRPFGPLVARSAAAQRELTQIDEKLFLELYTPVKPRQRH